MLAALAGFVAGSVHVLAGPDHLAAILPFAVEDRNRSWIPGALWGFGHSFGVAIVAVVAIAIGDLLPLEILSGFAEQVVGLTLIAIGLWGLHRSVRIRIHAHPHTHSDDEHQHFHVHVSGRSSDRDHAESHAHQHTHAPLAVGALHGIAGGAHLVAVLPAVALPTLAARGAYIGAYAVATIGVMTTVASLAGRVSERLVETGLRHAGRFLASTSTAALLVGVWWLL